MKDDRVGRLPRWAQSEITRLQEDLARANERLAAALAAQGFADEDYAVVPTGRHTVRFHLSEQGDDYPYIEVRRGVDPGSLEVYGSEGLSVRPRASNVLVVQPVTL